jgi:hypothetical protein
MSWATLSAAANRVAFARLGSVSVTAGAVSGRGFLLQNSEIILGGEITVIDYLLEVLTAEFGSLSYGDTLIVDGQYYKAEIQPQRYGDGTWSKVPLQPTTAPVAAANNITTLAGLRLTTLDGRYLITL